MATETDTGEGIKGKLTHRVGPLPVWGWAVVVAGSIGIVLYIRRNHGAAAASGTQQDIAGFGDSTGFGGGGGSGGGGGGGTGNGGGGDTTAPNGNPVAPHDATPPPPNTDTSSSGGGTIPASSGVNEGGLAYQNGSQTVAGAARSLAAGIDSTARIIAAQPNTLVAANYGSDAHNRAGVAALTSMGYTAGYYGGQVYAASNNQAFFNGLAPAARLNLARLLVAQGDH